MRYVYSIVRFVPEPRTGKFVNVAVIAGSEETGDWEVRRVGHTDRARHLGRDYEHPDYLSAVWDYLDQIDASIDAEDIELTEGWLASQADELNNLVQLAGPLPLVADSAADALDTIFPDFVLEREPGKRAPYRTKAIKAIRASYVSAGVPDTCVSGPVELRVGPHRQQIDFAVANGRTVQLAHAWSHGTQSLAPKVKTWAYTLLQLRKGDGGEIALGDDTLKVEPGVDLEVVYVPGQDDTSPEVDEAFAIYQELSARSFAMEDAAEVGQRAAEALHATT